MLIKIKIVEILLEVGIKDLVKCHYCQMLPADPNYMLGTGLGENTATRLDTEGSWKCTNLSFICTE